MSELADAIRDYVRLDLHRQFANAEVDIAHRKAAELLSKKMAYGPQIVAVDERKYVVRLLTPHHPDATWQLRYEYVEECE